MRISDWSSDVCSSDLTDLRELARIDLGNDADNVRVDPRNAHVLVGYGKGGLATIDAASGRTLSVRSTCGDADDLFLVRGHVLLICGTGYVEVIAANGDSVRVQTGSEEHTSELQSLMSSSYAGRCVNKKKHQ